MASRYAFKKPGVQANSSAADERLFARGRRGFRPYEATVSRTQVRGLPSFRLERRTVKRRGSRPAVGTKYTWNRNESAFLVEAKFAAPLTETRSPDLSNHRTPGAGPARTQINLDDVTSCHREFGAAHRPLSKARYCHSRVEPIVVKAYEDKLGIGVLTTGRNQTLRWGYVP
jgi:hypothetical protein